MPLPPCHTCVVAERPPALLFDLDGTLVDSVYQHVLAWHEVLGKAGMELSVWRIHRRIGMSGGLFVNALSRETGRDLTTNEVRSLQEARDRGASHPEQVAAAYFSDPASQAIGARYLRDNIKYDLGSEELEGLERFYRYASELELVRDPGWLQFY